MSVGFVTLVHIPILQVDMSERFVRSKAPWKSFCVVVLCPDVGIITQLQVLEAYS